VCFLYGVYAYEIAGIEDMFKRLRRVCEKGAENKIVSVERLYDVAAKAARQAFPNVGQEAVTTSGLEKSAGDGWDAALAGLCASVDPTRRRLSKAVYHVRTGSTWLPKPIPGFKTCSAPAYSQQVGFEECLLQWGGGIDEEGLSIFTKSWACGLVHTVAASALDLGMPVVLASESEGQAWLIIACLGRCLLGWPLSVSVGAANAADAADGAGFLYPIVPMTVAGLRKLVVTKPCPNQLVLNSNTHNMLHPMSTQTVHAQGK
jgi:hypothetical protein